MEILNYRVLKINLANRMFETEVLDSNVYRKYLGGRNIIAHYLLNETPKNVDPLSEHNLLIFATGLLTGTPVGCAGRNSAGAKSPLTGGYGEGEAGGYFGSELRMAGFDAIVIKGISSEPIYISIMDGVVEFRNASHLWGKLIGDTHKAICRDLEDDRIRTAIIGPAGENLVPISCIMNDVTHAYGRCGLGAVMGSKKIKAIAVRGHQRLPWVDTESVKAYAKWFGEKWRDEPSAEYFAQHGTIGSLTALNAAGGLPTRNFQKGQFEKAEQISGEELSRRYLVRRDTCYACPIRCKRVVESSSPYRVDRIYGGPEYETAAAFGSNCGIEDLGIIIKANELCNAYGIDTIAAGATIAWAMECYEKGLLQHQVDEMQLNFGNGVALLQLLDEIAYRKGLGIILGNGAWGASKILGKGSEFAMHVKGQDFPMHEPRIKHGLGLSYAVSPTGADHMHAIHDVAYTSSKSYAFKRLQQLGITEPLPATSLSPAKIRMSAYEIIINTLYNTLVMCNATRQPYRFDLNIIAGVVNAISGWNVSTFELMKVGERGVTLARAFNIREGLTVKDDNLPNRCYENLIDSPSGKPINKGEFEQAIKIYYQVMGWDELQGIPTFGKLVELDIDWVEDQIIKD